MADSHNRRKSAFLAKNWLRISAILIGPALAGFLYVGSAGSELSVSGIAGVTGFVVGGVVCAVAVSVAVHRSVTRFTWAVVVSVPLIELSLSGLLIAGMLLFGNAEAVAWLPVAVFFLVLFTSPMAVLTAVAIGRMLRDP